MIKCKYCNKELDESNFYRSGEGYRQPCKSCRVLIAKEKYKDLKEKKCGRCGKIKSVAEFDFSRDYGYQSFCKECKKERYKQQPEHKPQQTGTKVCSCCGKEKDINDFSTDKKATDGRLSRCRECVSKYDATRTFPVQQTGTKFCPRCNKELPVAEFSIARGNPDGRFYCCKTCAVSFSNDIVEKQCEKCGQTYQGRREKDKYCPDCKIKYGNHTQPEWDLINILDKYNIKYECEYNIENRFWYDFYLPEYKLLIDVNPTYTHAAIDSYYPAKRKYYHWDRRRLANKSGFKSICIWDWDNKEAIIQAIKENKLKINQKQNSQKHWNILNTKERILDNGTQNESQMIAEGYLPVYDDGQTLIY